MRVPLFARTLAGLVVIAALVGCQAYKLVSPGPTPVAGGYTVTPTVAWNQAMVMGDERWTTEGNALQEVAFADIGPGDRMFNAPIHTPAYPPGVIVSRVGENKLPPYRADMTLFDVKDFIEATLVQVGAMNVRMSDMHPAKFGTLDGFRMDFGFDMKSGLARKGFIVGAQTGARLKLIIYSAAEVFYYARGLAEAERLVASVQFTGPGAADVTVAAGAAPAQGVDTNPAAAAQPAPQPANPNLIALPPRPDGAPRRAPVTAPAPATAAAPPTNIVPLPAERVVNLPPCSSLPYEQPPGTRNINDAVVGGRLTALLPVAAPVRVNKPCIPDEQPQGTAIRDVLNPGSSPKDSLKPITAIATPAAAPAPVVARPAPTPAPTTAVAAPAPLPLCSSLPFEQPPGTRSIADATALKGRGPVAAPVRVNKPCIPDP